MFVRFRTLAGVVLLAASVTGATVNAQGQSKTATLKVSASIAPHCLITAADLAFGNYDPVGANATTPLDAQTTIELRCTAGVGFKLMVGMGQNEAGGGRRMAAGTNFLSYGLFDDAARTTAWRSFTYRTFGATSSITPRLVQLYGRIPAGQDVAVGAYADQVVLTVSY